METFIRFQTSIRCTFTGRPLGIFRAAGYVKHAYRISSDTAERIQEAIAWFNVNLPAPTLHGRKAPRSLFWFRSDAAEAVVRASDLIELLQAEDVEVEAQRTATPGAIVYSDVMQVAAIPDRKLRRFTIHALRV
ncbi:MAG: hypothetical protein K8T25_14105 [Planctomycetia bacterium]|nr:hypothetical protein [Planctomycetia bacterium]